MTSHTQIYRIGDIEAAQRVNPNILARGSHVVIYGFFVCDGNETLYVEITTVGIPLPDEVIEQHTKLTMLLARVRAHRESFRAEPISKAQPQNKTAK